jgi:hypothetical protein
MPRYSRCRKHVLCEAIFSEELGDEMYLWWVEFKEAGGRPIQNSIAEIDRIHLAFWEECIEKGSRQVMRTELVLIPEYIRKAIASR